MELKIVEENGNVTFYAEGQLDTTTFSDFEEALQPYLTSRVNLILDFKALEYLSSAGLRVILRTQQKIEELNASLLIRNCNEEVMEVFEITGFTDFYNLSKLPLLRRSQHECLSDAWLYDAAAGRGFRAASSPESESPV